MIIRGAVRRSQFVAPFGPGAMQVLADGTSVITAGLDHWFAPNSDRHVDREEFRIDEWRLERHLGVNALYTPPDYRRPTKYNHDEENLSLSVPVLRFPSWGFCPRCRGLTRHPLHHQERPWCGNCMTGQRKRGPFLSQVPFIALCERGHLQDFPWAEWVHRTADHRCPRMRLELRTSGGGTLASQTVICTGCDKRRPLEGITSVVRSSDGDESSYLTEHLEHGAQYSCRGAAPWLGISETDGEPCGKPLRAALRGAANVYYALIKSSIFIPEEATAGAADPAVVAALEERVIVRVRSRLHDILDEEGIPITAARLRKAAAKVSASYLLEPFDNEQLEAALAVVERDEPGEQEASPPGALAQVPDRSQAPFRRLEYQRIRDTAESPDLVVRQADNVYEAPVSALIPRIRLVEKLRETRALWGFNRVFAEYDTETASRFALLRREQAPPHESWLPAYTVLGEGIYLELDSTRLAAWEEQARTRLQPMNTAFHQAAEERRLGEREITPRLVLVHTLAHLLINQLTYECGYSSASLRERLYVEDGHDGMAGMLIYTAAGDSEGTLGGLVRMGQPGRFEPTLRSAVSTAGWCSADPVCIDSRGQGPDSCNLAACHSCALLPETACEEFNRFLDRALVVGTLDDSAMGFFNVLST
ncbi:DrmB family protein [Streptomyces sp. 7N604]|uniref:DrmB family protein n=1 Tax=Streptomyces sp. 7N604 TaxID=3457415 RepID=UPI003FCF9974